MSDFWLGVSSSLIGAIIGAILSFFVTWFFSSRDKGKQKKVVWYVVREEITSNYALASRWLSYIEKELEVIQEGEGRYLINPLPFFQVGLFNKIMFHLPKELQNDPELFNNLRIISQIFEESNEIIQKIKEYKGPLPISNKSDTIKKYNDLLEKDLLKATELIEGHHNDVIFKLNEQKDELKKIS